MQSLLIIAFGELSDEDWKETVAAEEAYLRERIASYSGGDFLKAEAKATNIGRGADWTVLAVFFGLAAVAIPQAHKKVRESVEEWILIYRELHAFFAWLVKGRNALYPDEYLFLKAIETLSEQLRLEGMEFKGMTRIPESNPDLQGREAMIFSFGDNKRIVQVAVARNGNVLWDNSVEM
ncbi:hypothetical protein sS8_0009 [Methylocaldum marinum]|uniref:Uncharacterized protein n=1 Tax=Methylocaldum marinum TaxID=1432792 RepID=A0A286T743_9GAMM|nr:hypothetical protein [Methylocaldum marinum]BBA31979.1 hypothetical protein sS8_0009 [Methylocaldum marinum]